jgi:hypothetical protein
MITLVTTTGGKLRRLVYINDYLFIFFKSHADSLDMTADTFIRKSEEAITSHQEHVDAFVEFSAALPAESVLDWTKLCQKWEKDRTKQNPFMNLRNGMIFFFHYFTSTIVLTNPVIIAVSEAEVRLRLAQEDADELAKGKQRSVHEDVSPSMLICQGLELEDLQ